ncbi:MAG TPA: PAS domain S-box protein [Rubrobacter sp.]|nr:PAS domain S-box protein [Rubrobacter sp.]
MKALHGFERQYRPESGVLRILLFEHNTPDAQLIRTRLSEGGVAHELDHVQSREAFVAALEQGEVDLILADFALPGLDGLSALRLAMRIRPGVPFIFVSDSLGEEVAIQAIKSGATDYVLKHRLERLRTAIRRAMREVEERRQRERAEEEFARLAFLPRVGPTLIVEATVTGEPVFIDPAAKEQIPGLIELGGRHPALADLASVARKIRESGGQPDNSEVRVDGTLYQRVIFMSPGSDLVRLYVADVTERRRAEETLRESEEQFRWIFEQATVGVAQVGIDGRWLRVNDKLAEITGYSCDELLERTFQDITHHDELDTDLEQMERLLSGEIATYSREKRYIKKDGSTVWVNLIVSLVRDRAEDPKYFVSAVEDISKRRRAEEALKDSEELYRTVVEQTPENIFIVDLESRRIVEANAALQRSLGYTLEELKGMVIYDVVADDLERVDEITEIILREGTYFVGERKYRRKDGSLLDVEVNVGVVPYGDRRAMCIVAHDVTDHKHSEIALRESLSVLLALREAGQVLSSTLESEEIVTRLLEIMRNVANLTAAVISRFDHHGNLRVWRSAGLEELWPRVRFTPEAEAARRAVLNSEGRQLFRLRRPGSEGDFLVGLCLPIGTRVSGGVLEAYGSETLAQDDMIEIVNSMTGQAASALENARLYEELGKRERTLQNLVGKLLGAQEEERRRVAYEVHDGLAQVAVAAHQNLQAFARRHVPEEEQARRELDRILKQVRATVSDARRVIANLRPTALDDLGLAAAVSLEVERLSKEGYHVDYDERLGDERLPGEMEITLFRVTQEALTNMRKHAGTNWVSVELVRRDSEVHLEVRDGGRGFDPAAVERLGGGPGERVGLQGMRERVSMLGGELEVQSRPNAGTSIAATIPLIRTS